MFNLGKILLFNFFSAITSWDLPNLLHLAASFDDYKICQSRIIVSNQSKKSIYCALVKDDNIKIAVNSGLEFYGYRHEPKEVAGTLHKLIMEIQQQNQGQRHRCPNQCKIGGQENYDASSSCKILILYDIKVLQQSNF